MKKFCWKAALPLVLSAVFMAACATSVPVQVDRVPALDTSGIRRVAVMPFAAGEGLFPPPLYAEMSRYITALALRQIHATSHFTLVNPDEINRLRSLNQSIESHVDALFTGNIINITVNETSSVERRRASSGQTYEVVVYRREAVMQFNYFFSRSRDASIIGPVFRSGSANSFSESHAGLLPASQLLAEIADSQLALLYRDVVPHRVSENRRLARESSRDRYLRSIMDDARSQVRSGDHRAALAAYLDIYRRFGNFAAAQNAAILHEALGETSAAAALMQAVLAETGNPAAGAELARLNRILGDQALIAGGFGIPQTERVAAHAAAEVRRSLPGGARVFIASGSENQPSLANDVIDNMAAGFIRGGVNLVDRQHIAIIMAEQNLHASGLVSDGDFISIGNLAGANVAVIVSIIGEAANRRLQVSVLDLERGVPLFHSDAGEAWRL
ncbi:MAG: hypothetical protein FWG66_08915 [Spirochaetes bacterium]|nr:hypothetical protein [Spirochaetota bacterium]